MRIYKQGVGFNQLKESVLGNITENIVFDKFRRMGITNKDRIFLIDNMSVDTYEGQRNFQKQFLKKNFPIKTVNYYINVYENSSEQINKFGGVTFFCKKCKKEIEIKNSFVFRKTYAYIGKERLAFIKVVLTGLRCMKCNSLHLNTFRQMGSYSPPRTISPSAIYYYKLNLKTIHPDKIEKFKELQKLQPGSSCLKALYKSG